MEEIQKDIIGYEEIYQISNFGLGYFNDNENLLLNAIDYLKNNYKYKKIKYK